MTRPLCAPNAGLRSLSVMMPQTVRTNDFWRTRYPELVADADARSLARVFAARATEGRSSAWETELARYLQDPFRGSVERRVLAADEPALETLELPAARAAVERAGLAIGDVDLLICAAFPTNFVGIGDAAHLARALGLKGAAWNLETACSSALVAFETACGLVRAGQHRNVLVVTCCAYSRVTEPSDSLSWTSADGAAAFVVGPVADGVGLLGFRTVHTGSSCDALAFHLEPGGPEAPAPVMRMRLGRGAGEAIRDSAEETVPSCCHGAAEAAGVGLQDIAYFVPNTPAAWFSAFFARKLGIDVARVADTHPRYGNIGPALWPTTLHEAASEGRFGPGDLVMLFAIGSVSSASAAVVRWGDVKLGPRPRR